MVDFVSKVKRLLVIYEGVSALSMIDVFYCLAESSCSVSSSLIQMRFLVPLTYPFLLHGQTIAVVVYCYIMEIVILVLLL